MIILTLAVFSLFKNKGVKFPSNPPNRTLLLRNSKLLIEVEGMRKDFLRLFEPYSRLGLDLSRLLFRGSKSNLMVV